MEIVEAIKKVRATTKVKENYMVISMAYDMKVVLPHKDGVTLMASLASMERLDVGYERKGKHCISPLDQGSITMTPMSHEEYEQYKIAALLDLTISEVKEMMKQPANV